MTAVPAPPVLEVDLGAGVRAAFTTAEQAFNLSLVVGDDETAVRRRRADVDRWAGAPVAYLHQVHAAAVHVVLQPPSPGQDVVAMADAAVTDRTDLALGVMVADCVPVLLADPVARVVAAVHAGRRGLVAGVVQAAVQAMVERGAQPSRTTAVVGPAACGRCYEVPAQMRDEVAAVVPGVASSTSWGTPALDLTAGVLHRLVEQGVTATAVGGCTIEQDRWFSHRAATAPWPEGLDVPGVAPRAQRPVGRTAAVVRLLPRD